MFIEEIVFGLFVHLDNIQKGIPVMVLLMHLLACIA